VSYEAGDTNWSSDGTKITFEYDINGMRQSDPNAYAEVWTMNPKAVARPAREGSVAVSEVRRAGSQRSEEILSTVEALLGQGGR
jgi:hypothetical protein